MLDTNKDILAEKERRALAIRSAESSFVGKYAHFLEEPIARTDQWNISVVKSAPRFRGKIISAKYLGIDGVCGLPDYELTVSGNSGREMVITILAYDVILRDKI